jgi:hypothetical protein
MTPGVAQLGDRVRDPITGFEGICVSVIQYLQGCERIGVLAEKLDKEGKPQDWHHMDNVQLKIVKRGVHQVFEREKPVAARTGGPRPDAPQR